MITKTELIPIFVLFTFNEQPVVDNGLDVGIEESCDVMAHLKVWDMDKRASWGSQWLLTQDPHDQLTVFHNYLQKDLDEGKCIDLTWHKSYFKVWG